MSVIYLCVSFLFSILPARRQKLVCNMMGCSVALASSSSSSRSRRSRSRRRSSSTSSGSRRRGRGKARRDILPDDSQVGAEGSKTPNRQAVCGYLRYRCNVYMYDDIEDEMRPVIYILRFFHQSTDPKRYIHTYIHTYLHTNIHTGACP